MSADVFIDKSSLELLLLSAKNIPWGASSSEELSAASISFLSQLHSALDPSSLDMFRLDDLASTAKDFWDWSHIRQQGETLIRTKRVTGRQGAPLNFTTLEICGPDMPFIVRSVIGACHDLSMRPILVIHPILDTSREENGERGEAGSGKLESYVQVYLDLLDAEACQELEDEISSTLSELRVCVADFGAMQKRMKHAAIEVLSNTFISEDAAKEASAFLNWLADDHFTFLGSREYRFQIDKDGSLLREEPEIVLNSNLGILRDETRYILHRGHEPTIITEQISDFLYEADPLIVSKGSLQSRIHRRVRVDYVGVKEYDSAGKVIGETRFAGLFTADAYNRQASDVPLIRRKVANVIRKIGKPPGSHDESALKHILESYPRDELFQISEDDLTGISLAILQLQTRNETRVFIRKDRFSRFISALVYVPRESFHSDLRARIADVLCEEYDGVLTAFYPQYGDSPLARILFLIDLKEGHREPNPHKLEERIAHVARGWNDRMRQLIRQHRAEIATILTEDKVVSAFTAAYRESFEPEDALTDLGFFARLSAERQVICRAYRHDADDDSIVRAKIFTYETPVELSNCVPIFEHMGLFVYSETGYPVSLGRNGKAYWVHDLKMRTQASSPIELSMVSSEFEDAFEAIWTGKSVSDGFNRLVLSIGTSWREAALFRTMARYRKQTGMDPGQAIQIQALVHNASITELLLKAFQTRFDPDLDLSMDDRKTEGNRIAADIHAALDHVPSLDEDRVLRRFCDLVHATQRTNFYQLNELGQPHEHISIKIASRELEVLPDPKPFREIFIWAPHVEGVHLRFGPVARGGLRWSDRQDDFRTEVLGLVKAQQVKNAVIVPVGSKGGFFPKQLPKDGTREDIQAEGIRAYCTFIGALLQLTDNLIEGSPKHPKRTIVWDGPDPYLVVAADKGTATFSDIANGISTSLGFWLGDAFASGGSAGYDHKKMGITARGGWVAVQRHFREIGVNVQSDPVTVIGVGDMSGDVFGNGMLLSRTILLRAAFNHMHIFIDPVPVNPEACWAERKRLFDMPRSGWSDYDDQLISKGGGVFSRAAKRIDLTPEIQAMINTTETHMTPNDLIRALLKSEADLLWFGGIGTYVKASFESHLDVGDKANDGIRVDATELRVKVIGEGANLGLTQAGRIAFAQLGGRINTDAIDNSAGVDSSDHEVNIKILLSNAIEAGDLASDDRNALLASMTDEVADLVLVHNYSQTGALSAAQASSVADLDSHERFMEALEARAILNRHVEGLPKPEDVRARQESQRGLTRPELAVLLAYAKITLFDEIVASDIPDDEFLQSELKAYFPAPLHRFETAMNRHRLRREIIATRLANDVVNLGGITFVHRVRERAGTDSAAIVRAFVAAKKLFELQSMLDRIDALDNKVSADTQIDLRLGLINALRRHVFWLASTRSSEDSISSWIDHYSKGVRALIGLGADGLSRFEHDLLKERTADLVRRGAPADLALDVSLVDAHISAIDIVDLSDTSKLDVKSMAMLFNAVGDRFQFDRLRYQARSLSADQHWDRLALRGMVDALLGYQHSLTERLSRKISTETLSAETANTIVSDFINENSHLHERFVKLLADIEKTGAWTFAKLVLLGNGMRSFLDETESKAH